MPALSERLDKKTGRLKTLNGNIECEILQLVKTSGNKPSGVYYA